MLIPDVNVLVGAYRTDAGWHDELKEWLEQAVKSSESVGLTGAVISGFVRIVTRPRIFSVPTPLSTALNQMDTLRNAPSVLQARPGPAFWDIFARLCGAADARGNLVAGAEHAATVMEAGATWITLDRDFAWFEGLRWESPLRAKS